MSSTWSISIISYEIKITDKIKLIKAVNHALKQFKQVNEQIFVTGGAGYVGSKLVQN